MKLLAARACPQVCLDLFDEMTVYAAKACGCFTNQVLQQSQFDLAIVDAEKHTTEKSTGTATHVVYTIRFQVS